VSEATELTVVERAAVALKSPQHEQELLALATKYADITEIRNPAGREQAHGAMMELANRRVSITKAGKEARDDANAFSKAVIAEEKRLVGLIEPEEGRLRGLRDEWDAEREREKAAKVEAERVRVNAIRIRIDEMRTIPSAMIGKAAEHIARCIEGVDKSPVELADFAEFSGEAEMAKIATLDKLREMLAAQQAHEVEQARIAAERAQLERERAEAAERERIAAAARAEEERKAREAREAEEARQRAEREAHEAELRRQREEQEARLRAEREAEESRLAEQRAEIARQQAEIAAAKAEQERIEREAREAAEAAARAEAERIEADRAAAVQAEADRIFAEQQRIEAERRAAEAERIRREQVEFEANGPEPGEILEALATNWDVSTEVALHWLTRHAWMALKEPA